MWRWVLREVNVSENVTKANRLTFRNTTPVAHPRAVKDAKLVVLS
jgi:hypothetical protein